MSGENMSALGENTVPAHSGIARFFDQLSVQMTVIGALLMREIHTRYGRDNIGYLWVVGEPLLLASIIGLAHTQGGDNYTSDIKPMPYGVFGYTVYIIFRGTFNRASGALEANMPLLFHRMVTIFDIMVAKALIEVIGVFSALLLLFGVMIALGYADFPARPLQTLFAVGLMAWISFGLSLLVAGYTFDSPFLEKFVHPFSYFMVVLCGAFWQISWLPQPYREWMTWNPMVLIFEIGRYGLFDSYEATYYYPGYVIGVCAFFTYWGLIAIRRVRRKVHLS